MACSLASKVPFGVFTLAVLLKELSQAIMSKAVGDYESLSDWQISGDPRNLMKVWRLVAHPDASLLV